MFVDDLAKLRQRMTDAVRVGLVSGEENKNIFQGTLIQILNEAERARQGQVSAAQRLREQASAAEAQANAYAMIGNLVYNVLDGYVRQAEKANREEAERRAEREAEKVEAAKVVDVPAEQPLVEVVEEDSSEEIASDDEKPKRRRMRSS